MLIACTALFSCSGQEPRRLNLDDLSFLRPSLTSYQAMIFQYGVPLREDESDGEIRATYVLEQEAASLSNINGKGFVRGVGGFVNTYPTGLREVTLVFDAKTRRYKRLKWQKAALFRLEWKDS
jgi:hypothetical protein